MSLPTDIFSLIVGQIDTHDYETLRSLCLSTRFLKHEAEKRLYQHFGHAPKSSSFHRKLLTTLVARPELAALVRSYALRDVSRVPACDEEMLYSLVRPSQGRDPSDSEEASRRWVHLLESQIVWVLWARAIPLMVNLKELVYRHRGGGSEACGILASGRFQLKKLDWRNRWDASLLDFLKGQKELSWVKLNPGELMDCVELYPPIGLECVGNLTAFSGKQAVVEVILPFAPGVRNLGLHFTKFADTSSSIFDVAEDMARCMGQLRRLTLRNQLTRISVAVFEGAVDNLEYLAVGNTEHSDDAEVTTFISHLKKLKMFVLLRSASRSIESFHSLAVDLLRESNSLEQVVMESYFPIGPPPADSEHEYDHEPVSLPKKAVSLVLSRSGGGAEMRAVRWEWARLNRFFLPMCEEDVTSPGWIDLGPFVVIPASEE